MEDGMHVSTQSLLRNSSLKLIFELIGTFFLTIVFNCSLVFGKSSDYTSFPYWPYNQAAVLLSLWVLTIFGIKISGAHYNPAVSFAFIFRKNNGTIPRPLAIAYIVAQIIGGFLGALMSWFLRDDWIPHGNVFPSGTNYIFAACVAETIGSFLVVFFYLTQSEKGQQISKEIAITCFIMAASYVAARGMCYANIVTVSGSVFNPAIGLGTR